MWWTNRHTVGRDSESRQLLLFWGVVNYHNTLSVFMKRHRTSSPNGENKPTLWLLSLSTTAVGVGDARAILCSLVCGMPPQAIVTWQWLSETLTEFTASLPESALLLLKRTSNTEFSLRYFFSTFYSLFFSFFKSQLKWFEKVKKDYFDNGDEVEPKKDCIDDYNWHDWCQKQKIWGKWG